jgi:hypothetical protein
MKKLLLLLCSLMLSFNSYGEWKELFTDEDDITWHLNIETIKERDGFVYLWQMNSGKEGSSTMLSQNDCDLVRIKYIQMFDYDEPMLEGDSTVVPTDESQWIFLPPDSIGEFINLIVCELATLSLEEREERIYQFSNYIEEVVEEEQKESNNINGKQAQYVKSIAEKVKSNWRYQGANDDWTAEVYILQDRHGNVLAVDVRNTNVGDSSRAKTFTDSIERAVRKSTPLPYTSNDDVFDKELIITFGVN